MWTFGYLVDKHEACPSEAAVVIDFENSLWLPEQCGRIDAIRPKAQHHALIEKAIALGYRVRHRHSEFGEQLTTVDAELTPFTVRPGSLLGHDPKHYFHNFLGQHETYSGNDGELYVAMDGKWYHYLEDRYL